VFVIFENGGGEICVGNELMLAQPCHCFGIFINCIRSGRPEDMIVLHQPLKCFFIAFSGIHKRGKIEMFIINKPLEIFLFPALHKFSRFCQLTIAFFNQPVKSRRIKWLKQCCHLSYCIAGIIIC
jgi:hypothetical protein